MTVFESLFLAHLVGDWILQTEWQARNKSHNWRAMLAHVAVYHVVVLAALVWQLGTGDPAVYAVVVALAALHWLIDRDRSKQGLIRALRISSESPPPAWLSIMVDQSIHLVLLGVASVLLTS